MKISSFVCCLIVMSIGLCVAASAQAKQPQPGTATNVTATASAKETETTISEKKNVRRAARGHVRPRLFWMRRSDK